MINHNRPSNLGVVNVHIHPNNGDASSYGNEGDFIYVEASWEHTATYVTERKVWNSVELCTRVWLRIIVPLKEQPQV